MTSIRRLTREELDSLCYTRGELRGLAREHGVLLPRGALHHEMVRALAAAGVRLPPKQAGQLPPAGAPAETGPNETGPNEAGLNVTGPNVTAGLLARIFQGYREHAGAAAGGPGADEGEVLEDDPYCE